MKVFSLVDISGKTRGEDTTSHKVKLTLEPVTGANKDPVQVGDEEIESKK